MDSTKDSTKRQTTFEHEDDFEQRIVGLERLVYELSAIVAELSWGKHEIMNESRDIHSRALARLLSSRGR